MKFILNESMIGINGIEKISLKEVIEKFSYPEDIKIKIEKDPYTLNFELKYKNVSKNWFQHDNFDDSNSFNITTIARNVW